MNVVDNVDVNRDVETAVRVAPRVVDSDAHVNPPPGIWLDYLSPQFRELAPTVESDGEFDYIVFEGTRRKLNLLSSQAGRTFAQYKGEGKLSDMRVGGWMPGKRVEDMDRDGIDVAILFGGGPLGTANIPLYVDSYRAYNRWIADFSSHDRKRFKFVAYLPMLDVQQSIDMMRDAKKAGACGVVIPAWPASAEAITKENAQFLALTGNPTGGRQYRDAEFDAFWKAACDLDMSISWHLGSRIPRFTDKVNFLPDMPLTKPTMLEMVTIMLFAGVFDRFPALRVGLIEACVGWMAWSAEFMDRLWSMQRHWVGSPIKHEPSFYMDQNVYGSFMSDRVGIMLRHMPGGKNIMWSSDYPHSETTFPHSHKVIGDNFRDIPDVDRDWIVAGCAEKYYGLS